MYTFNRVFINTAYQELYLNDAVEAAFDIIKADTFARAVDLVGKVCSKKIAGIYTLCVCAGDQGIRHETELCPRIPP